MLAFRIERPFLRRSDAHTYCSCMDSGYFTALLMERVHLYTMAGMEGVADDTTGRCRWL